MPRSAFFGARREHARERRRVVAPRARQRGDLPAVRDEVAQGGADAGLERDLGELASLDDARACRRPPAARRQPPGSPRIQRASASGVEADLRGDVVGVRPACAAAPRAGAPRGSAGDPPGSRPRRSASAECGMRAELLQQVARVGVAARGRRGVAADHERLVDVGGRKVQPRCARAGRGPLIMRAARWGTTR